MSVEQTPAPVAEQTFAEYKAARIAEAQPVEAKEETSSSVVAEEQPEAAAESETAETSEGSEERPETNSESETEEDEQERDEQGRFTKRGLTKRFQQLTSQVRELKQQLAAKADTGVASPKVETEVKPASEGKPSIDQYETYDQYVEALADWKFEQREKARQAEETKRKAEDEQKARTATWQDRVAEFTKQHDDFDEVLESIKVPITPAVLQTVMDSENGPALAYWLAQHVDDLKRISGLNELAAAREIGKIEASLTQPKPATPAKQKVSAAPVPIKPVGGTAAAHKKPLTEVSFEEYKKRRQAGER